MMRFTLILLSACISTSLLLEASSAQELLAPPAARVPPAAGRSYTAPPSIPSLAGETAAIDRLGGGEQPAAYDLAALLSLASNNNPTLRQARAHVSAELGKALQAGLYPNPVFSYEAEQVFLDVPGDKDSPGEFQGGVVQQKFVTAHKLQISRRKYLQRARVAEHLTMVQQFRVCNDVRIHFYRTLAASEILSIYDELLKTAEDAAVTAQELYNMGQARRPEVRQANVALQRARLERLRAENHFRDQFRELSALVGTPLSDGSVVGELTPECDLLTFQQALDRLLSESPELAAARAKLAVDATTVRREEVEWVPDVIVKAGPGYNFDARETTAMAGVSVEIPLFDRNQGTIRQARADYARQRQEIQRLEYELQQRLAATYERYATAVQHAIEFERVILPESKAAYAELLESYKSNRVDWSDVLLAQRDYFDARRMQVDNLLQAREHEILVYGYLLQNGLMAASGVTPPGHIDATPKPR